MKETSFQYTVLGLLGAILLIAFISAFTKKKKDQYGTSISVFGKTLYKDKTLKENIEKAQDEETKKAISLAHDLQAKELTKKAV